MLSLAADKKQKTSSSRHIIWTSKYFHYQTKTKLYNPLLTTCGSSLNTSKCTTEYNFVKSTFQTASNCVNQAVYEGFSNALWLSVHLLCEKGPWLKSLVNKRNAYSWEQIGFQKRHHKM